MSRPPRPIKFRIEEDAVGMQTGRRELAVSGHDGRKTMLTITIEYTHYTGAHSAKGRRLARRLCDALNAVQHHLVQNEASIDEYGHPRKR